MLFTFIEWKKQTLSTCLYIKLPTMRCNIIWLALDLHKTEKKLFDLLRVEYEISINNHILSGMESVHSSCLKRFSINFNGLSDDDYNITRRIELIACNSILLFRQTCSMFLLIFSRIFIMFHVAKSSRYRRERKLGIHCSGCSLLLHFLFPTATESFVWGSTYISNKK